MNYNLLEEAWIPVLWSNGESGRVGVSEALRQAGRIRQVATSNPMDGAAIVRFLLALLYWCKGNPPDETSGASGEAFPADWFLRLDEKKDCFNLLGEGERFYQYRRSRAGKGQRLPANYLVHEVPTGTNLRHFRHSTDKVDGLCPACCAMGLLRLPCFATSGGRGKPPGVNQKPPVYVIPVGVTLAETLRLSWQRAREPEMGTPAWEDPDVQLPARGEVPLLVGLTWLPRRVWLDSPEEGEANCISCGRRERVIRLCVFEGVGSTRTDEGSAGRIWRDPHVIYEQSRKGDDTAVRAGDVLKAPDAAAGEWARIVGGMFGGQQTPDASDEAISGWVGNKKATRAWVVRFSTVQNDKYLEAGEWFVPLPSPREIGDPAAKVERWRRQTWGLAGRLQGRHKGPSGEKGVLPRAMLAAVRPHVEANVSRKVAELLGGADEAWEHAAREYGAMMQMVGRSISPGFTTAAVQRRQQIAWAIPNMRPTTGADTERGRKRDGDK